MSFFRLNTKLLWRSWVFRLYLGLSAAAFIYFTCFFVDKNAFINGFYLLQDLYYLQVAMFVFAFCIGVYFAQASTVVELGLLLSSARTRIWRFLALLCASCTLLLLPTLFCLVDLILLRASPLYCLRTCIWTGTNLFAILFLAQALGFASGSLGRSVFLYTLCVPAVILFTYLNEALFGKLFPQNNALALRLSELLSINKLFSHGQVTDYIGPVLDRLYWLRLGFKLLIGLAAALMLFIQSEKRKSSCVALFGCFIVLGFATGFGISFCSLYPKDYRPDLKLQLDYHYDSYVPGYHIDAYEGSLRINEPCIIRCQITINHVGGGDLLLRLDDAFDGEFSIAETRLHPTRKDDILTIPAEELPSSESFILTAEYQGRVYYRSDLESLDIFVTSDGLAALPSSFAFLPEIPNDTESHNYKIRIDGGLDVATNLSCSKRILSGSATSICLFSGFFDHDYVGEIPVIKAEANRQAQAQEVFSAVQSYGVYLDGENKLLPTGGEFIPKKLLILYYPYLTFGLPVMYPDYGICNYGFNG